MWQWLIIFKVMQLNSSLSVPCSYRQLPPNHTQHLEMIWSLANTRIMSQILIVRVRANRRTNMIPFYHVRAATAYTTSIQTQWYLETYSVREVFDKYIVNWTQWQLEPCFAREVLTRLLSSCTILKHCYEQFSFVK